MEGKIEASDTAQLHDRVTIVEERVQFNNESLREIHGNLDRLDLDMAQVEDKLAAWMERELAKIYDIINDNPLGK